MPEKYTITIKKLTDETLLRRACEMTMHGKTSNVRLSAMYKAEHSPIRTQLFWIEMLGIPSFVSVNFVRHKIGVEHFVMSNRDDRGGGDNVTRDTPVNHGMLCNAQAIINMARKRLCSKAHRETRNVMMAVCNALKTIDADLHRELAPDCVYRGRCHELKPCGIMAAANWNNLYRGATAHE